MASAYLPEGADGIEAPWNRENNPERYVDVTVSVSLSKTFRVLVDDYDVEYDEYDRISGYDYSECDLQDAVEKQVVLPQNLAGFVNRMFEHDLNLKAAKMPRYLKDAIEDCSDWCVDDFECILD